MIKKILVSLDLYEKAFFIRKVGVGRLFVNFLFQRVLGLNSGVNFSANFTSTFIGDKITFVKGDVNTLVSFAASNCLYVQSLNGIVLGHNVLIAPGVKLISANHSSAIHRRAVECAPITIGNDVWIGANAVILPGVSIANCCIIGAGSVVTRSFNEPGSVIVGNPARVLKNESI